LLKASKFNSLTVSTEKSTTVDEADFLETMVSQKTQNEDSPSQKATMTIETRTANPGELLSWNLNDLCELINFKSLFYDFTGGISHI